MRYPYTPTRMAKVIKTDNTNVVWGIYKSHMFLVECQMLQLFWKRVWHVLMKLTLLTFTMQTYPYQAIQVKYLFKWKVNICSPKALYKITQSLLYF